MKLLAIVLAIAGIEFSLMFWIGSQTVYRTDGEYPINGEEIVAIEIVLHLAVGVLAAIVWAVFWLTRRIRFSLRTLFVVVTLLAVVFAGVSGSDVALYFLGWAGTTAFIVWFIVATSSGIETLRGKRSLPHESQQASEPRARHPSHTTPQ